MFSVKNRVLSKIPVRSSKSAKLAAAGAGFGALFGGKIAVITAGVGAYLGYLLGVRTESKMVESEEDVEELEESDEDVEE